MDMVLYKINVACCVPREGDLRVIRPFVFVRERDLKTFAQQVMSFSNASHSTGRQLPSLHNCDSSNRCISFLFYILVGDSNLLINISLKIPTAERDVEHINMYRIRPEYIVAN